MKQMKFFASLLAALLLLGSCTEGSGADDNTDPEPNPTPSTGKLVLTATPDEIQANGEDVAQLTLTKGGVEIPYGQYKLYNESNQEVSVPNGKFTTTTKGLYYFWAEYGTEFTETIRVKAVEPTYNPDGPGSIEDPDANNTSFVRRVLLTQFTGTGCIYCPSMIACLDELMADSKYANECVIAAIHRYNDNDPMYLTGEPVDKMFFNGEGAPYLFVDFFYSANQYRNVDYFKRIIDHAYTRAEAPAGISAKAVYDASNRYISLTATVKAAITNKFRIGVWVLEDKIEAKQQNAGTPGNFDTHYNAVRLVDSKDVDGEYSGHDLGEIAKGKTASKDFALKLKENWVADNCRLLIFVTSEETLMSSGREIKGFFIGNVITMPITGEKAFEYKK